jgi:hypothetical protein
MAECSNGERSNAGRSKGGRSKDDGAALNSADSGTPSRADRERKADRQQRDDRSP